MLQRVFVDDLDEAHTPVPTPVPTGSVAAS
jgi:hypothetical protein